MTKVRIDKWLWAVRIYKTRSAASDACRNNKVTINGAAVKPSRQIETGAIIQVKKPPIIRSYKVIKPAEKRVSAKLAEELMDEVTPESELNKLEMHKKDPLSYIPMKREKGTGRPTKKERRDLDRLKGSNEI